jgi:hypothetical protein
MQNFAHPVTAQVFYDNPLSVAACFQQGHYPSNRAIEFPAEARDSSKFDDIVTFVVDVLPRMGYSLCTNIHPKESSFNDFQ